MTIADHLLKIGGLPSLKELGLSHQIGFDCLINVSGVDLLAFFPETSLESFALSQFIFSDIFSRVEKLDDQFAFNCITEDFYITLTTPTEREQFLLAARCLASNLTAGHKTYLFCHRGRGRSPAVAGAALATLSDNLGYKDLYQLLVKLQPQAHLSSISFAAISWCKTHT